MKATHFGHCQWCGSQQKLPGGVLSLHGYTTAHGWFEGVCHGSGHKPYEESCDLIAKSIEWAKARRASIEQQRAEALAVDPAATTTTWVHEYRKDLSSRTRGSVYLWAKRELIAENQYNQSYIGGDGKKKRVSNPATMETTVRNGYDAYARHLAGQIKQIGEYIEHQQARVDAWKPAELAPIEKSSAAADPIVAGQKRKAESGVELTVKYVDGPRVYWTFQRDDGTTRTGWTGTAAFRKYPKI
jgi:hypothetical protein